MPSINLSNIKRKNLGNVENRTQSYWLRSKYATSLHTSMRKLKDYGTVVENEPYDQENVGSNPAGLRAFSFSFIIIMSLIRSLTEGQRY